MSTYAAILVLPEWILKTSPNPGRSGCMKQSVVFLHLLVCIDFSTRKQ